MQIPPPPQTLPIGVVSPSLFEALRACKAKAVWTRFGAGRVIPETPNALLGTSFHKVMEIAALGQLPAEEAAIPMAARSVFDAEAQRAFDTAHPILRSKYPTKEHLPNYFLQRERAVVAAKNLSPAIQAQLGADRRPVSGAALAPEQILTSRDGQLKGKIDWLKVKDREVVDYKAGIVPQGGGLEVSDRERRQLMFYAYLAKEKGHVVDKGTIIRSNGKRCSIEITPDEATAIAEDARRALADYNRAIELGNTFEQLAEPSKEACWFCPCIPLCNKFWQAEKVGWSDAQGFGWHIQGVVTRVSTSTLQGLEVMTMKLEQCTGTDIPQNAEVTIEQMPISWITTDASDIPQEGETVRVVHARKTSSDTAKIFRADKAFSTVWRLSRTNDRS